MHKKLKQLTQMLAFELRSENYLVKGQYKACECSILVDGCCVYCGKKKDAKIKIDASKLN